MLPRQYFGWRHKRGLIPIMYSYKHGVKGYCGFPRSYIALQKPIHRRLRIHIRFDFTHNSNLGIG